MAALSVGAVIRAWDSRAGASAAMTLDAARRAEALGLDSVCVGDHVTFYGHGTDGLITLTAIAAVTSRIQLKTSVYLLPLRHPVPVALQAAQLDQLSEGRFVLGVGVGGEDPHEFLSCGVDPHTRGARTNEALQIVARLWREDHVSFEGEHFQIEDVTIEPKPARPIPIFIGGRSKAALVRTGRYGDGYTGIWQTPDRLRQARETIAEAAEAAGRDPAAIEIGMQYWTSVAAEKTAAREAVAERMEKSYRIPFERFERYTPYGTAAEVAAVIAPYLEVGVKHINLITVQATPEESIERSAEIQGELAALGR